MGRLAHDPEGRHQPLLLRLRTEQQRRRRRPLRRLRVLGDARIRRKLARRLRLPAGAAERQAVPVRDRRLQPDRLRRAARDPARPALLPAARLHRPARRLPPPGGTRAGDPPLQLLPRGAPPAQPQAGRERGQRLRQAALHPRSPVPLSGGTAHLPRLLREAARVAALGRRGGQTDRRHAGRDGPAAPDLHHLHLRQRLLLRRAPPHRRQVPRLRAGHPPALPDAWAGDQARHHDRRAGDEHRHRPDDPRTGGRRSGQEHRRALARPLRHRHLAAQPPAAAVRVLCRDQRRRGQRRRTLERRRRRRQRRGGSERHGQRHRRRRKTTRGSATGRTSTSPGRRARRSSTTSPRTRTSSTTSPATRTSPRSATTSTPGCGCSRTARAAAAANRCRSCR